jgi:hypothetical protein
MKRKSYLTFLGLEKKISKTKFEFTKQVQYPPSAEIKKKKTEQEIIASTTFLSTFDGN